MSSKKPSNDPLSPRYVAPTVPPLRERPVFEGVPTAAEVDEALFRLEGHDDEYATADETAVIRARVAWLEARIAAALVVSDACRNYKYQCEECHTDTMARALRGET